MKQFVLLAFLTLASVVSASAQSDNNSDSESHSGFQWGIKGGANVTKLEHLSLSNSSGFSSTRGYGYIGGFWGRFGNSTFFFQPEVYVSSRNTILHDTTNIVTNNTYLGTKYESNNATFTNVDIPLLIGTRFGMNSTVAVHINAGPVLSLGVSNQQTTANTSTDIAHLNYKTINYGWQAGAGVDIWRFSLDLRYESDLNKFTDYNGDRFRINTFSLSLGCRLSSL